MNTATPTKTSVRWMCQRDLAEVQGIENAVFEYAWQPDEFVRTLRQHHCIGMVAEVGEHVAGYMIYELHRNRLHILNFAVHASLHRQGIGTAMVDKLKSKLSAARRKWLFVEVRESNLDALVFFKAMGFRAISLMRDFYEDTTEDAILMQFRVEGGE